MLIGVLAQVETAVAPFVKPAGPEGGDDDEVGRDPSQPVIAGRVNGGPDAPQVGVGLGARQEDDLGVAISRDELDGDDEDEVEDVASGPRRSSPPPPKQAPVKEKRQERGGESKGKKRSRADDAGSSRMGKPEKPARPESSSRDEKKVKKKKKKKGGDEFDDLFSSIM